MVNSRHNLNKQTWRPKIPGLMPKTDENLTLCNLTLHRSFTLASAADGSNRRILQTRQELLRNCMLPGLKCQVRGFSSRFMSAASFPSNPISTNYGHHLQRPLAASCSAAFWSNPDTYITPRPAPVPPPSNTTVNNVTTCMHHSSRLYTVPYSRAHK
jgi:hypothetical protein